MFLALSGAVTATSPTFTPARAVAARGSERPRAALGIHAPLAREVQSILRRGGKI
jgi:hypothetical protein